MDWLAVYNKIIENAKKKNRIKYKMSDPRYKYYEKHHILPKCMGGTDVEENLVLLTAREHYFCHQLLIKIYPNISGLVYAVWRMSHDHKHKVYSKEYERLRKLFAKTQSKERKGKPSRIKGMKLSEERKRKMSIIAKKRYSGLEGIKRRKAISEDRKKWNASLTEEERKEIEKKKIETRSKWSEEKKKALSEKMRKLITGKKRSEETKQKMRENHWIGKGGKLPIEVKLKGQETQRIYPKVIDLDSKHVYASLSEAARLLGMNKDRIHRFCDGNYKKDSVSGYHFAWYYGDDYEYKND